MHPKDRLNILYLNPFGGQSHAAFQKGWAEHSQHRFYVLDLPAVHWKWRARHGALTLAKQAQQLFTRQLQPSQQHFDVVFCTSMLDLAAWKGLVGSPLNRLPTIAYFHENQFSYPVSDRANADRDSHLAYSNFLTAMAADATWFNSNYHRDAFFDDAQQWLRRMPDYSHVPDLDNVRQQATVASPGVSVNPGLSGSQTAQAAPATSPRAPVIGWVMRWEHDKTPELFVQTVLDLLREGADFRLCLLGGRFSKVHPSLKKLQSQAADAIQFDGFAESAAEYWERLRSIDIVVSTARHEFFGIALIEAILAGAQPLVPNRLAYPEVLKRDSDRKRDAFFYDDDACFPDALRSAINHFSAAGPSHALEDLRAALLRFHWKTRAAEMDEQLLQVVLKSDQASELNALNQT